MLTRELLRYKLQDGAVVPFFLRPTPAVRAMAEELLELWRAHRGRPRRELDEATEPLVHAARSAVAARGLVRVLEQRCTFVEPASARELRAKAFTISARLLAEPARDIGAHRAAVAAELGMEAKALAEGLYADLPQESLLEEVPALDAAGLLDGYNLSLAQGLLRFAAGVSVLIGDADAGIRRRVLKALRFHRLLATAEETPAGLKLAVSGPLAVLDRRTGYGLQFANLLPHLCTAEAWQLDATLRLPDRREGGLHLDAGTGLRAHSQFTAYVPEELGKLGTQLAKREPDWTVDDEPPILKANDGELIVADLRVKTPEGDWCVECFHRWHARPLARRLVQKEQGELPRLLVAVARDLLKLKEHAELAGRVEGASWAFAFSGFPTARALRKCLGELET